jgi:hypothetical protein
MKTAYLNVCLYRAKRYAGEIWIWFEGKNKPYPLSKLILDRGLSQDIKKAVKESPDGAKLLVINGAFAVVVG